jgi:hypothetical protein
MVKLEVEKLPKSEIVWIIGTRDHCNGDLDI